MFSYTLSRLVCCWLKHALSSVAVLGAGGQREEAAGGPGEEEREPEASGRGGLQDKGQSQGAGRSKDEGDASSDRGDPA